MSEVQKPIKNLKKRANHRVEKSSNANKKAVNMDKLFRKKQKYQGGKERQMEMLEIKTSRNQMKNTVRRVTNRLDQVGGRMSVTKNRIEEILHSNNNKQTNKIKCNHNVQILSKIKESSTMKNPGLDKITAEFL